MEIGASRRLILTELRQHGAMSIDALVDATGLSKTATRAHLVRMERDGVVARTSLQAEGPGRPPAAFCLTDRGALMFPSVDDTVLSQLISFLEINDAGELVAAFFEEMWSERMRVLLDTLGTEDLDSMSLDARLVGIEAALAEKHFMPVIERRPGPDGLELVTVRECNCPFPAAARASGFPCQLEIDFLSQALGERPRSVSIASSRKDTCTFEFALNQFQRS